MQIAIIGAGASGLTSYLFLVKNLPNPPAPSPPHEYVVYESHSISNRKKGEGSSEIPLVGSGLGIAPNGMNVLRELDQKLHDDVQARGFPTTQIDFKNGRGWHLGSSQGAYDYADHTEVMLMVSRQDVLEACFEHFPKDLIVHATVSRVVKADKDGKPTIEFEDGAARSFDLVIGADGVWSKTRNAILEEEYAAYYTGLFGVSGFISTSLLAPLPESTKEAARTGQCVMTFGSNGFFGYTPCTTGSSPLSSAQLHREEPVSRGSLGFWWSSFEHESSDTRTLNLDDMKEKLRSRHKSWTDPTIRRIAQSSELEIVPAATWVMPKAPTWVSDRIALVGDAAHALPSTSGQGISQSMLDTQALSLLLAHHLKRAYTGTKEITEEEALKIALQQYVKVRKPIVERILDTANRMANQKKNHGFFQEMLMYSFLKIIFTLFPDSLQRPITKYDLHAEIKKVLKDSRTS